MYLTGQGCQEAVLPSLGVVNINVLDVNDNPPKFTRDSYNWQYSDFNSNKLASIQAKDEDLGEGGKVKYRLAGQSQVQAYY